MRTVSDMARLLDVEEELIKAWSEAFTDHLSESTRLAAGRPRLYTESDSRVLALIGAYWENDPDIEHIHVLLNSFIAAAAAIALR